MLVAWVRKPYRRPNQRRRFIKLLAESLEDRTLLSSLAAISLVEGPASGTDSDIVTSSAAWLASANASWLHTSASGAGDGRADFTFDANPGATRTGTITIAGQTLSVTQAGSTYLAASSMVTLCDSGLSAPSGVAVDGLGNVLFSDTLHNSIKMWHADTQQISTLISSGLNAPSGIAVDHSGNVYIADTLNNAIKKWQASSQQVSPLISGLGAPSGVAVDDSGNIYVADTVNNAIKKWQASSQQVTTLVASGLNAPSGVAVDSSGNVYIADFGNSALKKWSIANQQVTTLATIGLNHPYGVAVDGSGNVYIGDSNNNTIKQWHASTQEIAILGSTALHGPRGVAVDGSGGVYVADTNSNAIRALPHAFVPGNAISEPATTGADTLLPVAPATQPLTGIFAPSSDQSWLSIDSVANGVVGFSFSANFGAARTAHITILGQSITVTQAQSAPAPAITSVIVNGGSISAIDSFGLAPNLLGQNSVVEQFLVTLNFAVTLDPNAFSIVNRASAVAVSAGICPSELPVDVTAAAVSGSGNAQFVLTFSGPGAIVHDNSINGTGGIGNISTTIMDGFYRLHIDGSKIHANNLTAIDNDTDFWALFGAGNPDEQVISGDPHFIGSEFNVASAAFQDLFDAYGAESDLPGVFQGNPPLYNAWYDANLDGNIDSADFQALFNNYGTTWDLS